MDIRKETVLTKKKSVRKNTLNALLTETGFATGGFLAGLATLTFGATPFGFALLCCSGKHTLSILAGVCLSALMHTDRAMLLAAYALVTILRTALSVPYAKRQGGTYDTGLFSEPPSLRVMTAALGAFLVGLPPPHTKRLSVLSPFRHTAIHLCRRPWCISVESTATDRATSKASQRLCT